MASLYRQALVSADVVLCTYDTLRQDFHYGGSDAGRRGSRRIVRSPLLGVHFWRVVLDEAQRGESGAGKAALLARRIRRTHAWAVTGTPLGKDKLADLHGLLLFLDAQPFAEKGVWRWGLQKPYEEAERWRQQQWNIIGSRSGGGIDEGEDDEGAEGADIATGKGKAVASANAGAGGHGARGCTQPPLLLRVLAPIMWRSTKARVEAELALPKQRTEVIWLRLSAVERLCYHEREKALRKLLLNAAVRANGGKVATKDRVAGGLDSVVLRLRHACIHPRLGVKGGVVSAGSVTGAAGAGTERASAASTQVASIEQIAKEKAVQAKLACEEELRGLAYHVNLLAGLELLNAEVAREAALGASAAERGADGSRGSMSQREERDALVRAENYYGWLLQEQAEAPGGVRLDASLRLHVYHNRARALRQLLGGSHGDDADAEAGAAAPSSIASTALPTSQHAAPRQVWQRKMSESEAHTARLQDELVEGARGSQMAAQQRLTVAARERRNVVARMAARRAERRDAVSIAARASNAGGSHECWWRVWQHASGTAAEEEASSMLSKLAAWHGAGGARTALIPDEVAELFHGGDGAAARALCGWIGRCLHDIDDASARAVAALERAPLRPTAAGLAANSNCRVCRADWGKCGAACAHCYDEALLWGDAAVRQTPEGATLPPAYEETIFTYRRAQQAGQRKKQQLLTGHARDGHDDAGGNAAVQVQAFMHDHPVFDVLDLMRGWVQQRGAAASHVEVRAGARAGACTETGSARWWASLLAEADELHGWLRQSKRELAACRAVWKAHSDLLSMLDEVTAFGSSMQLAPAGVVTALDDTAGGDTRLVSREQLPAKIMQAAAGRNDAQRKYRNAVSHLRFVLTLAVTGACATCFEDPFEGRAEPGWHAPGLLKCAHWFCGACIRAQLGRGRRMRCPKCRQYTAAEAIQYVADAGRSDGGSAASSTTGGAATDDTTGPAGGAGGSAGAGGCAGASFGAGGGGAGACAAAGASAELERRWGTKVGRLVGDLLALRGTEEKALVFSQWDEALALVAHALRESDVGFAWLKDRATYNEALSAFKHRPAARTRVLLLPLKRGGNGLTLTEARHVFLLEPALSSALEAQAIGRVHRIGQTEETTVHRYVVKDSAEERLYWMVRQRQHTSVAGAAKTAERDPGAAAGTAASAGVDAAAGAVANAAGAAASGLRAEMPMSLRNAAELLPANDRAICHTLGGGETS
eukprot:g3320.t1